MGGRSELQVIGGFEGSNVCNISRIGSNHFSCEMSAETPSLYKYPDHHGYWFYLRVDNAEATEVTIDITNCDWMPSHWRHYKPVCTYTHPDHCVDSRAWERIENTARFQRTFRFRHRYREQKAWVALRYPYTTTYNRRYLDSLQGHPLVATESILTTREGRDLRVATVTDPDVSSKRKKGILVYAREHANEQEGSWVCQGMIDFLLSRSPVARALTRNAVFLLIPIATPDAAYHGRCTDPHTGRIIACDFAQEEHEPMKMEEAAAIWENLRNFTSGGGALDICISLHSPHGWEENIWSNLHDRIKREEGKELNRMIFAHCNGYTTRGPEFRWGKFSLPGRCARQYGSIALLLEINQHAKRRVLLLHDLRKIGENICRGIHDFFDFGTGSP